MTAPYDQFAFAEESDLNGELLSVRYIRVQDAILWDENSKLHDIGGLIVSIEEHGFRDPPAWDSELGAIVEGNGRITALQMMVSRHVRAISIVALAKAATTRCVILSQKPSWKRMMCLVIC